jgi:hypothetical protein
VPCSFPFGIVDKLKKGGPTTVHEGEENFNVDLVHDTENEAEMDVESVTDVSYNNCIFRKGVTFPSGINKGNNKI